MTAEHVDPLAWSYEAAPDGTGNEGLEGYSVESSTGERAGTVFVVLRRGTQIYVGVTRPATFGRDVRLVPWGDVDFVDDAINTVRLRVSADALAAAPRLLRTNAVHGVRADAARVTDRLTTAGSPATTSAGRIPARLVASFALSALGLLALLAAVVFASSQQWPERGDALFALPAVVLLAAAATALGLLGRGR